MSDYIMHADFVQCQACGSPNHQVAKVGWDERGNCVWQCPRCNSWNYANTGEFSKKEAPVQLMEPLDLAEVEMQIGFSFLCPKCWKQNFIPIEHPDKLAQVKVTCYHCKAVFMIDMEQCQITETT